MMKSEAMNYRAAVKLIAITVLVLSPAVHARAGEIHNAACAGDLEKVRAVLKKNPKSVNERNEDGETPLHLAWPSTKVIKSYSKTAPTLMPATKAARRR